jgi:hypothetical protein
MVVGVVIGITLAAHALEAQDRQIAPLQLQGGAPLK